MVAHETLEKHLLVRFLYICKCIDITNGFNLVPTGTVATRVVVLTGAVLLASNVNYSTIVLILATVATAVPTTAGHAIIITTTPLNII